MGKRKSMSQAEHHEANRRLDPIIEGLLDRLPAPGDEWNRQAREQWLQVLRLAFDLIYLEPDTAEPNG